MDEYSVNDFITLKLEKNKTYIYVDGELFRQCKKAILKIPKQIKINLDDFSLFDEIFDIFGVLEDFMIDPKEEFLMHCSNLQAWADYGYDARIIHLDLANPLLKKLRDAIDPVAMKKLKEVFSLKKKIKINIHT